MKNFSKWLSQPLSMLRQHRQQQNQEQLGRLKARYQVFRALLDDNHRAVDLLTELGTALRSTVLWQRPLARRTEELLDVTAEMADKLESLTDGDSAGLSVRHHNLSVQIRKSLKDLPQPDHIPSCFLLDDVMDDMFTSVGGKAANLARLRSEDMFLVPNGFVVPVSTCRLFLEMDDLYLRAVSKLRKGKKDKDGMPVREIVDEVQAMIKSAPLSAKISYALAEAAGPFFSAGKGLAVRSSAVSEDSATLSFAGQYVSVLNVVNQSQLEKAFKEVIASSFNARNLVYRRHSGLPPYEFELAVLCLEMVDVRSAGILFTVDPNFSTSGNMIISAVQGLGELAVGGSEAADVYTLPRDGSGPGERQIARKSQRLVSLKEGGVIEEALGHEDGQGPVLSEDETLILVKLGMAAEQQLGGGPLDIEWAVNTSGEVILLQARPLKIANSDNSLCSLAGDRKSLLADGFVASAGCGAGQVRIINSRNDLENLSEPPYVLVMHQSLVEAVGALKNTGAILVDLGNPADHLSCVAREYEIPMLSGLVNATEILIDGDFILVNAEQGTVLKATSEEMEIYRSHHWKKIAKWEERLTLPDNPITADLYCRIVPLNLTDAYGPTFTIAECQSIHDLVRYSHEKAVLAMFAAGDDAMENASGIVVHLDSEVPFHFSIIDLGGGLLPGVGKRIEADKVLCRPFNALWRGVLTQGLPWGPAAGGNAVGSVMSRFLTDHRSARPIGLPNYALATRDFFNINARMDFHFTMVDTICGQDSRLNYIKFRFKGGGTGLAQRCRRVRCLSEILQESGFFCDLRDDLLTASIQGGRGLVLEKKLEVIGRVLGFSRLLDAAMHNDDVVKKVAKAFLDGDYMLESLAGDPYFTAEGEGQA